jgi:hypothetical protein
LEKIQEQMQKQTITTAMQAPMAMIKLSGTMSFGFLDILDSDLRTNNQLDHLLSFMGSAMDLMKLHDFTKTM